MRSIRLSDLGQLLDQPMNIATVIGRIEQRMVFISCHPTIAWHCQPLYVLNKMSCSLSVDVLYFCLPRPSSSRCATFLFFTRHASWKGVLVAVFSLSGYKYLGDSGTDRREILHEGTYRSRTNLPFWRRYPGILKSKILGL